jgi:hypothetical protein
LALTFGLTAAAIDKDVARKMRNSCIPARGEVVLSIHLAPIKLDVVGRSALNIPQQLTPTKQIATAASKDTKAASPSIVMLSDDELRPSSA